MHFRRLTCFLLGAWIAGGWFMAFVATENFRAVDRLLARPSLAAAEQIHAVGRDAARSLLRYQASEQNRAYFEAWEIVQCGLGLLLFLVLLFASRENKFTILPVLLMLALVGLQRFYLTPEITSYGRLLDFAPPGALAAERNRFWVLHSGYVGLELLKWLIGLALAFRLIRYSHRRSAKPRSEVDVVDKTYDRHVDG